MAKGSPAPEEMPFWRIQDNQIFIHPPFIRLWSKVGLVASVVIALLGGALAMMTMFHPEWFHLTSPQAARLFAPCILVMAVGQMMLIIKSVMGCLAVVRRDCVNVRGRKYPWKLITDVTMERPRTGPADKPSLVLHVSKKNKSRQVVMVPEGMVEQNDLAPLYHRVSQILKQAKAKLAGTA